MASENVVEVTDDNFETEVLGSPTPVVVDFWAEWCPPCRALAPTIEKLAKDYSGRVKVGKFEITESNRAAAARYSINNIPTLLFFKDGQLAQRIVGAKPERELKTVLDALSAG